MSRGRTVRAYKLCKLCGEGYDAFKAFDARGRYCSPVCLAEARRRHREGAGALTPATADDPVVTVTLLDVLPA